MRLSDRWFVNMAGTLSLLWIGQLPGGQSRFAPSCHPDRRSLCLCVLGLDEYDRDKLLYETDQEKIQDIGVPKERWTNRDLEQGVCVSRGSSR